MDEYSLTECVNSFQAAVSSDAILDRTTVINVRIEIIHATRVSRSTGLGLQSAEVVSQIGKVDREELLLLNQRYQRKSFKHS
jgi:hypothetical protein